MLHNFEWYHNRSLIDEFELEFSGSREPEQWEFRAEPSQAELGHIYSRAETKLTIPMICKGWFDEFDSNIRGPTAPHIEFSTIALKSTKKIEISTIHLMYSTFL